MKGQVNTAFYLITVHRIRDHIIKCTEEEAFRILGTKKELDATKLCSIVHAYGHYAQLFHCEATGREIS